MKTNIHILRTGAMLAAAALVVTGCSSTDSASSSSSSSNASSASSSSAAGSKPTSTEIAAADYAPTPYDQVKDGGEITTAIYEVPEQMNRFHADTTVPTVTLWEWFNPQLSLFDGEGNFSPNPDYVTDVKEEVVDGKTVVTYTINDKATWNDGTPIDWTAFETTWFIQSGKNPDFNVAATDGYENIASVTQGKNSKQAVVSFDRPYPWWQALFGTLAHPALKDVNNFNDFVKKIHPEWAAGPYVPEIMDFEKGEAVFVRNPKWWGNPGKLDRRVFRQMENQAALNAFKAGEIDMTSAASKERLAAVENMDGIELRTATEPFVALLELNAGSPVLKDPEVRKAAFQAIDRETLGKIRFNGLPYEETPPGSLVLYPFQTGYQDNLSKALPERGTDAAAKTLEAAGYTKNSTGIFEKDGKPLAIRYTLFGDSASSKATAQAVQKMLKDAGIDVTIDQKPSSDFSDTMKNRDFDMLALAFRNSDPYGVAAFGQTYKSDSQLNLSGTGTPEFDKKIAELQALPTAEEQIKRANELETEAFKLYGLMPYANGPQIAAVKKGLVNVGAMGFATVPVQNIGWKKD